MTTPFVRIVESSKDLETEHTNGFECLANQGAIDREDVIYAVDDTLTFVRGQSTTASLGFDAFSETSFRQSVHGRINLIDSVEVVNKGLKGFLLHITAHIEICGRIAKRGVITGKLW